MRVLVKDVMSKGVVKLKKYQTIGEVKQLFLERVIDGAPVVDESGKVIGVFTKTHLMRAMGKPLDTPIEMLMNRNVISISETMPIEEAMNIPVGRLPVVNSDGLMVGWLTRTDLASAFVNQYKKSIDRFWNIFNSTSHGIISVESDGRVSMVNKEAERLLGIAAETAIGQQAKEIFPNIKFFDVLKTGKKESHKILSTNLIADINPLLSEGNQNGAVAEIYTCMKMS